MAREQQFHCRLPFGPRPRLRVSADMGPVTLAPAPAGEEPYLEAFGRSRHWEPPEVSQRGGVVHIEWGGSGHRSDALTLYVPAEIEAHVETDLGPITVRDLGPCDLRLASDAGHIAVENVTGRLHASAEAGLISLESIVGRLELTSEAGRIEGSGLAGSFEVESEAGSIRLEILSIEPGEHRVETEAGSIELSLAPNLPIHIEVDVEGGSVRQHYRDEPEAPAILRVATEAGSIRIQEAWTGFRGGAAEQWTSGTEGAAGPSVRASTRAQDDWRTRRQAGASMPPVPPSPPIPPLPPMPPFGPAVSPAQASAVRRSMLERTSDEPAPENEEQDGGARGEETELQRILKMVESGALSAREAHELIQALEQE